MHVATDHRAAAGRRRPDGSIDTDFYVAEAQRLHRIALRDAGRRLRGLLTAGSGLSVWHPGARITPQP